MPASVMSSRLPSVTGEVAARAFERAGWRRLARRGRGTHILLKNDALPEVMLSVPDHSDVKRPLLRGLIRKAEMTVDQFVAAL